MTAAVAIACAALAALLLFRPPAVPHRAATPSGTGPRRFSWRTTVLPVAAGATTVWLDGTALVLALILLGCGAATFGLVRRAHRMRTRLDRRRRVVEVAEALVGELRAGQPPVASLQRCVEVWPAFEPVAAAARLGADVPDALSRLARLPGAESLADLGSAWRISDRTGAALTGVLTEVVMSTRAELTSVQLVRTELASAQATARLVAVLPLVTMAMAAGTGAQPWRFLLGHPAGLACLAAGAFLVFVGLWWIDRIAVAVTRR